MKRILNFMTVITILLFFFFSILSFCIEKNSNFLYDKTVVSFNSKYDLMHEELINRFEVSCDEVSADVVFVYYSYDNYTGEISEIELYTTNNKKGFLPFGKDFRPEDGVAYSTNTKNRLSDYSWKIINYPTITHDYTVYPISDISPYKLKKSKCLTDSSTLVKLSEKMSEKFIDIRDDGKNCIKDDTFSSLLKGCMAVCLFLLLVSMFFYQFSISKKNSIKILEGYNFFSIIIDEIKSYLCIFVFEYVLVIVGVLVVFTIKDSFDLFWVYVYENLFIIAVFTFSIPFMFILSNLYTLLITPLEMMKGKKYNLSITIITVLTKTVVMMVFILIMTANIKTFKQCYSEYKVYKNNIEHLKDYYAITISQRFVDDENYIDFYKLTHKRFDAIMMTSHYCVNPDAEGDINQWYIYVNDNYMDLNPILSKNGDFIQYNELPENKRTILVPEYLSAQEAEILKKYAERIKTSQDNINIIYYDNNQKFLVFNSMVDTANDGYIMYPIVIIHENGDDVSGAISNGEVIFRANTNDFYSEIKPFLLECGIDISTGPSVNVTEELKANLNQKIFELMSMILASAFLIVVFIIVVIYEAWIYYEENKRVFVIKKMDGYDFKNIHWKRIIIKTCIYLILFAFVMISASNICVTAFICFFDFVVFYGILESKSNKYSSEIMKGE